MAFLYSEARELTLPAFRGDLVALVRDLEEPTPWTGLTAIAWAQTFSAELANALVASGHAELGMLLSREALLAFCARAGIPLEFRIAAVMAWGRSNARNTQHNRKLWASIPNITHLIARLPKLTRTQAFAEFRHLVATGALRGMRASYFTKLMFFFACPGAYILDQWLAKSVLALLTANWRADTGGQLAFVPGVDNFVRLGYGGTSIALSMSEYDYEKYCAVLELLVEPLGRANAADVERWLFSNPGSAWRRFLKKLEWKQKRCQS